jgi:hypothetical protein
MFRAKHIQRLPIIRHSSAVLAQFVSAAFNVAQHLSNPKGRRRTI